MTIFSLWLREVESPGLIAKAPIMKVKMCLLVVHSFAEKTEILYSLFKVFFDLYLVPFNPSHVHVCVKNQRQRKWL